MSLPSILIRRVCKGAISDKYPDRETGVFLPTYDDYVEIYYGALNLYVSRMLLTARHLEYAPALY